MTAPGHEHEARCNALLERMAALRPETASRLRAYRSRRRACGTTGVHLFRDDLVELGLAWVDEVGFYHFRLDDAPQAAGP